MGKVIERELAWLSRDTPGFELFRPAKGQAPQGNTLQNSKYQGPSRIIAYRGSEIFVAVGSEVRWSEISLLKDNADEQSQKRGRGSGIREEERSSYRTLLPLTQGSITQLSVSPNGDYLAILTAHTCRVAILPASNHLHSGSYDALRLKSYQIGPTVHVVEKSPLATAIWHPLSPSGNCLVTVTEDACVRLWELDMDNRASYNAPSLAVDLRKLSNAATSQDSFGTSAWGTNAGYSPDAEEMQAAGACFGGQGDEDEHGWSSMTLWVAMTSGGVYALCPFLPTRWRAPAMTLPSLSTSVVAKTRAVSCAAGVSERERRVLDQQTRWLADIDEQEPLLAPMGIGDIDVWETYARPEKSGAIPKLQGPFEIDADEDLGEITDIHVIGPKIGDEALYDDEEDEEMSNNDGLSVGIICLATRAGQVHVCLDLSGVEAEWLPSRRSRSYGLADDDEDEDELLLFETINLRNDNRAVGNIWPTFTASPIDRYTLFSTQPTGVYSISFTPWKSRLEAELAKPSASGADLRLDVLLKSYPTETEQPISHSSNQVGKIGAAVAIADRFLGFNLLSTADDLPHSALLELADGYGPYAPDDGDVAGFLPGPEPRAPYQPDNVFFNSSRLPSLGKEANDRRILGTNLKAPIRFSVATLQLMTDAHRLLSKETSLLEEAAAALFRRVERMRSELQEQVRKVRDIADRVDAVLGEDGDHTENQEPAGKEKIQGRIEESKNRTEKLNERAEALQKRIRQLGGRELSVQERAYASEVKALASSFNVDSHPAPIEPGALLSLENSATEQISETEGLAGALAKRISEASQLRDKVIGEANKATQRADANGTNDSRRTNGTNGNYRRQKMEEVFELIERESALVEAVRERLDRLSAN